MEIYLKLKNLLLVFFVISQTTSFSQDLLIQEDLKVYENNRNIYFELAGSGGFGSFNYEKKINKLKNFNLRWRVGLSYTPMDKKRGVVIFPVMIHYLIGKNHHLLDLGIGQSISIATTGSFFFRMPISIGYRLDKPSKKYFWRFSYTPIVSYLLDFQWEHWGGVTFGYKLK